MLSPLVATLGVVAVAMSVATSALVRWASHARTGLSAGAALFLLAMMAAMFGGAVLYFHDPGTASLVQGLWVASLVMSLSVLPLFFLFVRDARQRLATGTVAPLGRLAPYFAIAVALVLANELLMGWAFTLAAGGSLGAGGGLAGAGALLVGIVASPWFLFTMALEMALTAFLLRERLPDGLQVILYAQAAIMFLSPTALPGSLWRDVAIYGASAGMIALVVYLMEYLYRHRELNGLQARYTVRLLGVYALMMAGLFLWLRYGSVALFALSVVAEMVLYFEAVLGPERFRSGPPFAWLEHAHWAFALMLNVFLAELFMGALLDVAAEPGVYGPAFPARALSGPWPTALGHAVSNGFWFTALVTGSTWFLLMMGLEMGALVVLKLRESKSLENRIRLGLLLASYAGFAVFFPSLYYRMLWPGAPAGPAVPFLGWSMGIGSAQLAPTLFGAVFGTYLVTGVLATLFGRRAICSVFCTAPLMFQGTTIDAMKSFNRTAPVGRHYLSSRLSKTYAATTSVVMASLVVASVVSYLDAVGRLSLYVDGVDPTVFLFSLYFGVVWYVMFVAIPYAGTYNCVTMGWCYTGTIAQAFQRVGFYRLKVRDIEVCRACTTVDCARGCPVGLTDMPGHFRRTGEYRSSKCCGVGDCAEACPYGNLYLADVRHWIARRLGRPLAPRRGPRLPVVPAATGPKPAAAPTSPVTPPVGTQGARGGAGTRLHEATEVEPRAPAPSL